MVNSFVNDIDIGRCRLTAAITAHFERIKEMVPVELVVGGVQEDEGAAALAAHPMTIRVEGSHEEDGFGQLESRPTTRKAVDHQQEKLCMIPVETSRFGANGQSSLPLMLHHDNPGCWRVVESVVHSYLYGRTL